MVQTCDDKSGFVVGTSLDSVKCVRILTGF